MTLHRGGCHCGRIAFRFHGEIESAEICNCSICHMKGYVHWYVARDRFELLTPEGSYTTYQFNTRVAQHHFCPVCGVAPFYVPDEIQARLLEQGVGFAGEVVALGGLLAVGKQGHGRFLAAHDALHEDGAHDGELDQVFRFVLGVGAQVYQQ